MTIRKALAKDASQLGQLSRSLAHSFLEHPRDRLPIWLIESLSDGAFSLRLNHPDYTHYVYEQQDKIIGFVCLKKPNHLYHLFVSQTDQRCGIATQLWTHLKQQTDRKHYVVRSSISAVPIYKRFGFVESASLSFRDGIAFQPMSLMLKPA